MVASGAHLTRRIGFWLECAAPGQLRHSASQASKVADFVLGYLPHASMDDLRLAEGRVIGGPTFLEVPRGRIKRERGAAHFVTNQEAGRVAPCRSARLRCARQ
jgi:hypothetical protein